MFSYDYILDGWTTTAPRELLETQLKRLTQLVAQALADVPPVSRKVFDWSHSGIVNEGSAYLQNALLRVHADPYPAFVIGFSAVLDGDETGPTTFSELWQMIGGVDANYQTGDHSLIMWISSDGTWTRLRMLVGTRASVYEGETTIIRASEAVPSGVDPTEAVLKIRDDTPLIPHSVLISWAYNATQFAPDFLGDEGDSIDMDYDLKGRSDSLFQTCFEYAPIILRQHLREAFDTAIGTKVSE
jgi:hypothetical protein